MPYYQGPGPGGLMMGTGSAGGLAGWTTTSSTTSSYNNPFYGACGGTATTTSTTEVVWVNTTVCSNLAQAQLSAEYQRMMNRHISEEEDRANELYDRRVREEMFRQQQAATARQAFERGQATRQTEVEEFVQKQKSARERARELLLSKLSAEQREAFTKNGWFVVEGGKSKRKYRIRSNHYQGNIDVLDVANKVIYRLCVHCALDIPLEDHLLAQKIMLELAEDDIIKLANRHAA